jgi:hypothetical protein
MYSPGSQHRALTDSPFLQTRSHPHLAAHRTTQMIQMPYRSPDVLSTTPGNIRISESRHKANPLANPSKPLQETARLFTRLMM